MGLPEVFGAFTKTIWFRLLYFTLFGAILGFVLPFAFALGCLIILGIGIAHFAMPYLIGERNVKRMGLFALYTTVIATLIAAAFLSNNYLTIAEDRPEADMNGFVMQDGHATPYQTEGSSTRFTTNITFPNATYSSANVIVYVLVQNVDPFGGSSKWYQMSPDSPVPVDGPLTYTAIATLPADQLHLFRFEIFNSTASDPESQCPLRQANSITQFWERECQEEGVTFLAGSPRADGGISGRVYGPITISGSGAFVFSFVQNFIFMIFPLFTFGIIALMFWWTRRARDVRAQKEKVLEREKKPGDFTCSNCGTDVPSEAVRCPKCGALFEEPEDEPVKTATKVKSIVEKAPEPEAKVVPDSKAPDGK